MTKPRTVALAAVALAIGVPVAGSVAFADTSVNNCDLASSCTLESSSVGSVATANATDGGAVQVGDVSSDFATESATAQGPDSQAVAVNVGVPFGQADATAANGGTATAVNLFCGGGGLLPFIGGEGSCVSTATAKARGRNSSAVAYTVFGGQATAHAVGGGNAQALAAFGGRARAIAIGRGASATARAIGACHATSISIASVQLKRGDCGILD